MNLEKGVSLIITFFILTIILAVVLSISVILYSQIKVIRNIGNSVVAFYLADSGMEKSLYYMRHGSPENNGTNGLCNICNVCPSTDDLEYLNCLNCNNHVSGNDCGVNTCKDCTISFDNYFTDSNGNGYNVSAVISQDTKDTTIDSGGVYDSVARKIELKIKNQEQ